MTAVEDGAVLAVSRLRLDGAQDRHAAPRPIPSQERALTSTTASGDQPARWSREEAGWLQDELSFELPADAEGARAGREAEESSHQVEVRGRWEQLTLPLDRVVAPSTAGGGYLL